MKVVRASLALNDVIVPLDLISFAYVVYGRLIHIAKWSEISMRMRSMGTHTHAQRAHSTSTAPRLRLFFCLFLTHLANIRFGSFFLFFFLYGIKLRSIRIIVCAHIYVFIYAGLLHDRRPLQVTQKKLNSFFLQFFTSLTVKCVNSTIIRTNERTNKIYCFGMCTSFWSFQWLRFFSAYFDATLNCTIHDEF